MVTNLKTWYGMLNLWLYVKFASALHGNFFLQTKTLVFASFYFAILSVLDYLQLSRSSQFQLDALFELFR